ncbi:5832_t:CDS:1, partial [Gigaspora rosea]
EDYDQEHIARNVTNIFLQEVKSNALRKILRGFEGSLVEVVSR